MRQLLKHRRLHSLIVCLAILLNLFAPAIGHAMASLSPDAPLLEMCSAAPALTAAAPASPRDQLAAHGMKHCMFCASHADTYVPPALPGLVAVLDGHDAYPAPAYQSPAPLVIWSSAQPRGPPALS